MPLKISCLIGSCGDEIGYVERCAGIWRARGALVDGMQRIECRMWSRIEHIKLAVLCACEREDEVICMQPSFDCMEKYVPPIQCTHPTSRKV